MTRQFNRFAPSDDDMFTVIGSEIQASFIPSDATSSGTPSSSTTTGTISGTSATTVAISAGGITFDLIFDAAAMAASSSLRAGIQQAATILSSTITDKITVNLKIDISGSGGGAAAGPDHGLYESYSLVSSDLINNASSGDATFNALPSGASIQGQSNVAVWNAQLKLWGLLAGNDTASDDGSATFAADIDPSLIVGVALHELTHALGRIPYGSAPDVFDLFRFTSPGVRLFQGGATAPAAYFSLEGGNTKIADYGQTSDSSDFLNSGVQGSNDPFNEFYSGSTSQALSAVDLQQLDALGFHFHTNHPPVVTVPQTVISAHAGQTFAASSLFSASDADGDTLTYYLYESTTGSNSGHFSINGAPVATQTVVALGAGQLAQTTFVAGSGGTTDDLYVMAYDGHDYSGNTSFTKFQVAAAPNHPPVVTISSPVVSTTAGQALAASSLFNVTDADNDTLTYYLYEGTTGPNSGHFSINGTPVASQTVVALGAGQLAQTTFVAGSAGTTDSLYVMAYDGHDYSGNTSFTKFQVAATPNHPPVVTISSSVVSATAGQALTASSLFNVTDADNDTLTYFLYEGTTGPNSGHFSINGTPVATRTVVALGAGQLAQTTFVAGSAGTTDDLYVMAYDGHDYSNNTSFTKFQVAVASHIAPASSQPTSDGNLATVFDATHHDFHLL